MIEQETTESADDAPVLRTENEIAARQHIFSRQKKRKEAIVTVPEWDNMEVMILEFSATERSDYYHATNALTPNTPNYFKRLLFEQVRRGCVHPVTQKPIFKLADEDFFMGEEGGTVISWLAALVREVSGLNADATVEAKKKLQSILKPSTTTSLLNGSGAE